MKTFSDRWRQLEWDDIRLRINGKTAADVERALNAAHLSRDDLMALLPRSRRLSGADGAAGTKADPTTLWQHRQFLRAALSLKPLCQRLHLLRLLNEQPH